MKGLFKNRSGDPVSAREKELNEQIASLEDRIKKLNNQLEQKPGPRLRSTALPHPSPPQAPLPEKTEIVFESVDQNRIKNGDQGPLPNEASPDIGTKKYNLAEAWDRLRNLVRGSNSSDPKLFKYLAAGNIQGLRPLRYEKRIARNRFFLWFIIFFAALWGLIEILFRR